MGAGESSADSSRTEWNLTMAASILFMVPVIVLFFLAQRVFVEGVTVTGVRRVSTHALHLAVRGVIERRLPRGPRPTPTGSRPPSVSFRTPNASACAVTRWSGVVSGLGSA